MAKKDSWVIRIGARFIGVNFEYTKEYNVSAARLWHYKKDAIELAKTYTRVLRTDVTVMRYSEAEKLIQDVTEKMSRGW
jgi:hypothetical protein